MIKAFCGLEDLVTNVNLPNVGQIANLPLGTVVETNAVFADHSVTPIISRSDARRTVCTDTICGIGAG